MSKLTRLLTVREVAGLLDRSPETILRWVRAGKLPAIRLPGGAIRFREEDLDHWISLRVTTPATLQVTSSTTHGETL
ncbi:MAG: helix-turn-helix domain-containing protein [Thermoleophilaceae bacterium]|nr:helix-turn-helix domain-containing protein [Thermoleophilaceae bacterium]